MPKPKEVEEDEGDDTEEDEDDEEEEEEDSEESEGEEDASNVLKGTTKSASANDDDEYTYEPSPVKAVQPTPSAQPVVTKKVANNVHDEEVDVDGDHVDSDEEKKKRTNQKPIVQAKQPTSNFTKEKKVNNESHDEEMEVNDGDDVNSDDERQRQVSKAQGKAPAAASSQAKPAGKGPDRLTNRPHDEEIPVDDGEHVDSEEEDERSKKRQPPPKPEPAQKQPQQVPQGKQPPLQNAPKAAPVNMNDDESDADEEENDSRQGMGKSGYDPSEYANLKVTNDVKELFSHIVAYKAQTIELDTKLRPFIPDYIPGVGEIDTFTKVPRPDNKPDNLGLTVLDEPSSQSANPSVVKLALQYSVIGSGVRHHEVVDSIEDARNRPQLIDKWISDITNLHKKKPSTSINYAKPMPDVEALLQVWPGEFEDLLSNPDIQLPPGNIDLSIHEYAKMICVMLDIPIHANLIESLHVLFTLYTEFKANQHFSHSPEL